MQMKFQNEEVSLLYNSNYGLALSFSKKQTKTEIDLKEAQRFFAQKFSCGASATGEDEIIIQGDFTDDIIDVIQEKWLEVHDDSIEDLGEVKKGFWSHVFLS